MDNLADLQRRKAELKAQIEQQRNDLKQTFLEIRTEIEPANLLKKAVSGVFGFSKNKPGEEKSNLTGRLPAPVTFLLDLLVRDSRLAFLLKLFAPVALKYLPKSEKPKERTSDKPPPKSAKSKIYSQIRRSVSGLRSQLRKAETAPEKNSKEPEN